MIVSLFSIWSLLQIPINVQGTKCQCKYIKMTMKFKQSWNIHGENVKRFTYTFFIACPGRQPYNFIICYSVIKYAMHKKVASTLIKCYIDSRQFTDVYSSSADRLLLISFIFQRINEILRLKGKYHQFSKKNNKAVWHLTCKKWFGMKCLCCHNLSGSTYLLVHLGNKSLAHVSTIWMV